MDFIVQLNVLTAILFSIGIVLLIFSYSKSNVVQENSDYDFENSLILYNNKENCGNLYQYNGGNVSILNKSIENTIIYIKGDATQPTIDGKKIIAHICNDIGIWSNEFVQMLSNRWIQPEESYRKWHELGYFIEDLSYEIPFELGYIQIDKIENNPEIFVCNMIAQMGKDIENNIISIDYRALDQCMEALAFEAITNDASVHLPRFDYGLLVGGWDAIEAIILRRLLSQNIPTYIYYK